MYVYLDECHSSSVTI